MVFIVTGEMRMVIQGVQETLMEIQYIETSSSTLKQVTYTDWSTFNGNVEKNVSLLTTPKLVVNQIDNIIIYSFFCLKAHHQLLIQIA